LRERFDGIHTSFLGGTSQCVASPWPRSRLRAISPNGVDLVSWNDAALMLARLIPGE
jgi:hypothetical protein